MRKLWKMNAKTKTNTIGVKDHIVVENGKEAVEGHDNAQYFDLILMDGIKVSLYLCCMEARCDGHMKTDYVRKRVIKDALTRGFLGEP